MWRSSNHRRFDRAVELVINSAMALFFPATTPTRRRRRRLPYTAVVGILSAILSAQMIVEVYRLHQKRQEKQLEEIYAPRKKVPAAKHDTKPPAPPPPLLTQPQTTSPRVATSP